MLLNADFKDILLALEGVPVHEEVGGEEGGEKGRASGMRMSKESLTIDEFYVSSSDDEDGESGGAGVAAEGATAEGLQQAGGARRSTAARASSR